MTKRERLQKLTVKYDKLNVEISKLNQAYQKYNLRAMNCLSAIPALGRKVLAIELEIERLKESGEE